MTCEFTDQESGAKQERPGWSALTHEARDLEGRRFDAVVIYSTSRLARDRLYAALFERELDKVGVTIHYAIGRRGPRHPRGQGLSSGCSRSGTSSSATSSPARPSAGCARPPSRATAPAAARPTATAAASRSFPRDHKGDRDKRRVTLEPEPEEAKVVAEIFDLFVDGKHSPKAIADHLNQPGGPPSPRHVDPSRNLRGHWAASTIRAMLQNPVYTGRTVWNRLDFTEAKHDRRRRPPQRQGGVGDRRGRPPAARLPTRSSRPPRPASRRRGAANGSAHAKNGYVLSRDGPLLRRPPTALDAGQGAARATTTTSASTPPATATPRPRGPRRPEVDLRPRGPPAAARPSLLRAAHLRAAAPGAPGEAAARPGPQRAPATASSPAPGFANRSPRSTAGSRRQVQALEDGVEPELVSERIAELRADKEALEETLAEVGPEREEAEDEELAEQLEKLPDLSKALARGAARDPAPGLRGLRAADRLRQGRRAHRDSRRPSPRPSPTPSRTRKPSARRAQWWS